MFDLFAAVLSNFFYLILHVNQSGTFKKPLSHEEEEKCLNAFKAGDINAKNKLIEHNLRLVAHIIKKYYNAGYDHDDLISIGTIGLIKAVSSYSNDKCTKFATYASRCIENEILMHFRHQKKAAQDVSMYDPIDSDKDGNALTLSDIIADDFDIIDDIDMKIKTQKLHNYMSEVLSPREQTIIKYRYGLDGCKELPQREVAKMLNISRSYISRIEKQALKLLYDRYNKK